MDIKDRINNFLTGEADYEETAEVLLNIAQDKEWKEAFIDIKRDRETIQLQEEYGAFIPASSMAADDGRNLCDVQCELHILRLAGIDVDLDSQIEESRSNYWLRDMGTPLFSMGKILEKNGFMVHRKYVEDSASALDFLLGSIKDEMAIAVVNGNYLDGIDYTSDNFSLVDCPNHAVVVSAISLEDRKVVLYNPAESEESTEYDLDAFLSAWAESKYYLVTARPKKTPVEYDPQPFDVSEITLSDELINVGEMLCEDAHDRWGARKKEDDPNIRYAPKIGNEEQKGCNHFFVPYSMLSEKDKDYDRDLVFGSLKLLKRLGFRLVNINSEYKCPDCGGIIELSDCFCRVCGRRLETSDFIPR